jgi:hypothetical protein
LPRAGIWNFKIMLTFSINLTTIDQSHTEH